MDHTLDWLVLWVLLLPLVEFLQPLQDYLVLLSSMLYSKSVQDYHIYSRDTIGIGKLSRVLVGYEWGICIVTKGYEYLPVCM